MAQKVMAVKHIKYGDIEKKGVKASRKLKRTSIGNSHNTRSKSKRASRERRGR